MMFGFLILVIIAYYLYNSSNSRGAFFLNHQVQTESPMDILNKRYARGEINREEYLERKRELSGQQTISLKKG